MGHERVGWGEVSAGQWWKGWIGALCRGDQASSLHDRQQNGVVEGEWVGGGLWG